MPKLSVRKSDLNVATVEDGEMTVWSRMNQAVSVRHGFKEYGHIMKAAPVLVNFNMSVAKGTIYGLLGASGCGKTTLLSCLVGRRKLNSGEILVLGGSPGAKGSGVPGKRVGYMPQEIALYGEFTIKETMMYFGWIFGMQTGEIMERLQFLLNFLDLPSHGRLVKNLSGGQQRRVSFAVALLHDPELLILDEPTVGVDPLLRQSIWSHLVDITKSGQKTVIITTHYIEEARQAHTIGLMRSGRLLAEESPQTLLTMYGCHNLEDVFLKLSRKQGNTDELTELNISNLSPLEIAKLEDNDSVRRNGSFVGLDRQQSKECANESATNVNGSTHATATGMQYDESTENGKSKWKRNVSLFCLAVGRDPKELQVAIANLEVTDTNCTFATGCNFSALSCRYLSHLSKMITRKSYSSQEAAVEAVRRGEVWAALVFPETFTDSLVSRVNQGIEADNETLDESEIRIWVDMSNQQIGSLLKHEFQLSYMDFTQRMLIDCEKNPKLGDSHMQFKKPVYGSVHPSFTDFVAPGVITTVIFFLAISLTSSALISEKSEGLLDRSWVAGVAYSQILLSHVITQFLAMCGQTALVLIFMLSVFDITCNGNMFTIIVLTLLQGMCGMCFGFVVSSFCEEEGHAIQLSLGAFYPTLMLSGVIWPLEGMPTLLRYISLCLPLTQATTAVRFIMSRGWGLNHQDVFLGFVATIIWIAFFLAISFLVFKKK
ncbi:ABC transporter G family member 20, partial [Pseudolycoriella hygida]